MDTYIAEIKLNDIGTSIGQSYFFIENLNINLHYTSNIVDSCYLYLAIVYLQHKISHFF